MTTSLQNSLQRIAAGEDGWNWWHRPIYNVMHQQAERELAVARAALAKVTAERNRLERQLDQTAGELLIAARRIQFLEESLTETTELNDELLNQLGRYRHPTAEGAPAMIAAASPVFVFPLSQLVEVSGS